MHNTSVQDMWNECNDGPVLCQCGCGIQTTFLNWIDGYRNALKGHWNKGLTKETDLRVSKTSENLKGRTGFWSIGLTRENSLVVAAKSRAISISLKATYQTKKINFGLPVQKPIQLNVDSISDFIKSLSNTDEVITNDIAIIKPQRLDVWIPLHKTAIEFNNLDWRSELMQPDRKFHSRKSNRCIMNGIRLLHVFEDEWRDKRNIVESMIKARLGIDMQRIDARKCAIKVVSPKHRKQFFNDNHVDGDVKATVAYGLYHENELVYCMSLRRPFHRQYSGLLDVVRCASRTHTFVRGGLGRLTKVCMRHASDMQLDGLMTYVDIRFGGSNAYQSAGWQFLKKTDEPRYWWSDGVTRYNSNIISARQAKDIGLLQFWGCRQAIYVMR